MPTIKFKSGEKYAVKSICDQDCRFEFEILKRTNKSVWFFLHGFMTRKIVKVRDGVEEILPLGNYSMCPILKATGRI